MSLEHRNKLDISEPITHQADELQLMPAFWDCNCERGYIKPKERQLCPDCCALRDDCPDSSAWEAYKQGVIPARFNGLRLKHRRKLVRLDETSAEQIEFLLTRDQTLQAFIVIKENQ